MEVFPLELQLFIAKKGDSSSSGGLLSFRASTTLHRQLSEDVEMLRVVSAECLHLLTIPSPNVGQRKFMLQLILSGHVLFCVVQAAKILILQTNPPLKKIVCLIRKTTVICCDKTMRPIFPFVYHSSYSFAQVKKHEKANAKLFELCRDYYKLKSIKTKKSKKKIF